MTDEYLDIINENDELLRFKELKSIAHKKGRLAQRSPHLDNCKWKNFTTEKGSYKGYFLRAKGR